MVAYLPSNSGLMYEWIYWTKIAFDINLETLGQAWMMLELLGRCQMYLDKSGAHWMTLDYVG